MTEADLLNLINGVEQDLTLNKSVYNSPGFSHIMGLVARVKSDPFVKDTFCKLFDVDASKLPELFATIDQALLLEERVVQETPARLAFLDGLKAKPAILWTLARLLN